jgi:hypothetical protein
VSGSLRRNGDFLAFAQCDLENQRDKVKLRVVIFAPRGRCTGGIEVPQTSEAHAVNAVEPIQHSLKDEFRFAVRAAWDDRMVRPFVFTEDSPIWITDYR